MKKNLRLLYGFSLFDQFMIVIALWVPYLATNGIGMRQFMELQAVFALRDPLRRIAFRTALEHVGKEEDAAAWLDAQGGQLFRRRPWTEMALSPLAGLRE